MYESANAFHICPSGTIFPWNNRGNRRICCKSCGVKSGRDVDKFDAMHLTPLNLPQVSVPGIAESPVNSACKVSRILHLGSHDMFLADVVGVTVDDSYMNEKGKFELNQSGLVTYSHGEYFLLGKKLGSFGYSVKKQKPSKNGRKKKAK